MRKTISVAMIEPVGGHGGMDYYDLGLCRGLLAAGCQVSWYTCDETAPPMLSGLRFYPTFKRIYGKDNRWLRAYRYLRGGLATISKVVASGEKIVHFHLFHGSMEELFLIVLAKICRRKVVITVHDVESFGHTGGLSADTIGRIYGLANGLIVHNAISRSELTQKLGISVENITVIPHGNYLDTIRNVPDTVEAKRTLGISESKQVVLFFGQIKEVKGLDILLGSIPNVSRVIPEVVFLIAGRPWKSDFSYYEALIDELGVRDLCTLHIHFIPDDEIASYYAAADVVVLPYRRIYQSGVILMAMSYQKPVLVSDLPGMTEIVNDSENGYTFPQGSKDHLSEALIRVLHDEQGRARVAANGLAYVKQHHSWEKIGQATSELYRTIISRHPGVS